MKKFLLVIFFTMVPVLAHGGTYYVAKTGSDSNSCNSAQSQSTPKLTINTGIGCLSAGDTLIVKPGIYAEILNPDNNGMQSGTAGNPITIRSETQYGAVIQPDSSLQSQRFDGVGIVSWRDQSYIVFDGFVVDANNLPNAYLIFAAHTSHHITIVNNELRNGHDVDSTTNSDGVYIAVETHDILVGHNKIHDIGIGAVPGQGFYSYGIYWPGHNSIAEYNEIYNSSGYGIHMYNAPPGTGADNNIIRNNIIHDNGAQGILLASGGTNGLVYNNVIYHNGIGNVNSSGGIGVGGFGNPSTNNQVYNNTIYNNIGRCIEVGSQYQGSDNNTIKNNLCWQNSNDTVTVNNGSGNTIDHNLSGQNPLFVNAAAADFQLRAGSPAIDAGVVMPGLSYNGSAPDLGAVESGAGGQLPAPKNLRLVGN